MLDGVARKLIDPPLNALGRRFAGHGIGANQVTLAGLALGLLAVAAIAWSAFWVGLVLILLNRIADGLDGAIARATSATTYGGYLDIVADFAFYGAVPFAFVVADPANNAVAGAFLLVSFYINGASFLGYAVIAEQHKLKSTSRGKKSLYFTPGWVEGTETIALFAAMCVWPALFSPIAVIFGALTLFTALTRMYLAYRRFGTPPDQA